MDRTFREEDQRVSSTPAGVTNQLTRQRWVKPTLERLSLQDALTSDNGGTDGPSCHS